ncbi:TetR family transcriptional regulator [Patulibacter sp.]|uniref:TetR/AcrR family transcriptional regulator n=1 Tax=Patulibacter sp. TaxID=1912859 RepID=UPI0027200EB7|nr:TetR family transcriptional regulator [Patulibacter sp.]MDO9408305.1 TetR family transcriptional regulator [Patulibacter sp.]
MTPPPTRAEKRAATARRILDAAQEEFGERGLEGTTVRAIAARAQVDPSLVIQHYGTKVELFAVATRFDQEAEDDDVEEHLVDVLRVRMDGLPPQTRALVRSMLTAPEAAAAMKAFLDERTANLARATGGEDAELRAALAVSGILGLTVARHFLELEGLREITDEQITSTIAPWLRPDAAGDDGRTPSPAPTSVAPVFSTTDVDRWLEHYRALGFAARAFDETYGFASRDGIELHVALNPEHDPARTAGCAYLAVTDADALAAEWAAVQGGRHVAPVDTDYGTREGAHVDPDGNLMRFGSPRR